MADKITITHDIDDDYCDEVFDEDRKPNWPFKSEDEEHRFFDDLQRVRDIRSSM